MEKLRASLKMFLVIFEAKPQITLSPAGDFANFIKVIFMFGPKLII